MCSVTSSLISLIVRWFGKGAGLKGNSCPLLSQGCLKISTICILSRGLEVSNRNRRSLQSVKVKYDLYVSEIAVAIYVGLTWRKTGSNILLVHNLITRYLSCQIT